MKKLTIPSSILFLFLFFFVLPSTSHGQFLWGKQAMGDGQTSGNDIAVDPLGNNYVIGNMDNTITFEDVTVGDVSGNSFEHNYIAKYDPSGDLLWVRTIKGNSNNELWSVTTDADGNAYVSGSYSHTNSSTILDFGNIQLTGNLSDSGFFAKIDADGNWQWAKALISENLGGQQHVKPMVIRVLPGGDILLSGYLEGPVIIDGLTFNPGDDNLQKIFFSKFNASGDFQWFKFGEGAWGNVTASPYLEMQLDGSGNSYIHCVLQSGASYGGETLTHTFGGGFVVASFDSNGDIRWWESVSSSTAEILGGLTLDDDDNVYVAAQKGNIIYIGDDVVLDDLLYNLWIFKFDSAGNYISASAVLDGVASVWPHDITYHPGGYIFLAGAYEPVFGTPVFFGDTLGGGGYRAAFLAAYNTNGKYLDAVEMAYPEGAFDGEFLPKDLITDGDGKLLMTGKFDYEIEIGDIVFTSDLLDQMFTLKMDITDLFDLTSSAFNVSEKPAFRMFPNPASDYVQIEKEVGKGRLQLVNHSGQIVKSLEIEERSQLVDLAGVPLGTYYLTLGSQARQLVIIR